MTEENQKKLYKHNLSLLENPNPNKRRGIDADFVLKQAQANIDAALKTYPQFADKPKEEKPKETKEKKEK